MLYFATFNNTAFITNTSALYSLGAADATDGGPSSKPILIKANISSTALPYLALDPTSGVLYVSTHNANSKMSTVYSIGNGTNHAAGAIYNRTSSAVPALAVDQSSGKLYFSNYDSASGYSTVFSIDSTNDSDNFQGFSKPKVMTNIKSDGVPIFMDADPVSKSLYMAYSSVGGKEEVVSVYDSNHKKHYDKKIPDGSYSVYVDPGTGMIYSANRDYIYVINSSDPSSPAAGMRGEESSTGLGPASESLSSEFTDPSSPAAGMRGEESSTGLGPATNHSSPSGLSYKIQNPSPNTGIIIGGHHSDNIFLVDINTQEVYVIGKSDGKLKWVIPLQQGGSTFDISDMEIDHDMLYLLYPDSVLVIDGKAGVKVTDLQINNNLYDLAVDTKTRMMYVSDYDSNAVYVIDGKKGMEVSIPGKEPYGRQLTINPSKIMSDPFSSKMYIANKGEKNDISSIFVMDGSANNVSSVIKMPKSVKYITVDPYSKKIFASDLAKNVFVINEASGRIAPIPLPEKPLALAVNPKTHDLFIATYNYTSKSSTIYSLGNSSTDRPEPVASNIKSGPNPVLAVEPESGVLYAATYNPSSRDSTIYAIDPSKNQGVQSRPIASPPTSARLDVRLDLVPTSNAIYASDGKHLSVINATNLEVINDLHLFGNGLDDTIEKIAVDENMSKLYVVSKIPMPKHTVADAMSLGTAQKNLPLYHLSVYDIQDPKHVPQPIQKTYTHLKSVDGISIDDDTKRIYLLDSRYESYTTIDEETLNVVKS